MKFCTKLNKKPSKMHTMLKQAYRESAMSNGQVTSIVIEELHMRKVCTKLVPKILSDEQKASQVVIMSELLECVDTELDYLDNIITGNKTWTSACDLEKVPKFRMAQSKVKIDSKEEQQQQQPLQEEQQQQQPLQEEQQQQQPLQEEQQQQQPLQEEEEQQQPLQEEEEQQQPLQEEEEQQQPLQEEEEQQQPLQEEEEQQQPLQEEEEQQQPLQEEEEQQQPLQEEEEQQPL
ncbi:UPF0746 protein DDB_G0281095-like [Schistocerca serialis cubense]|uniref:UPF0746 protein DDB_G0281095-like n=1 Tax=Schistocerca serialis cubense TaxID=2023355 RepID=UPI00214F035E|nr:UPF0746 protein DDB_G0281095-like [Schistocerca serialis cubense]